MHRVRLFAALAACSLVYGCSDDPTPCAGVTCSGHGTCFESGGAARCACEAGFAESGPDCVAADPCASAPCQGEHRVCRAAGATAVCECEAGWADDGAGGCAPASLCTPNPCAGEHRSVCVPTGSGVRCDCDPGYRSDNAGGCVAAEPCSPNPCTAPNRGVCTASNGTAICSCDAGWRDDGQGGCVPAEVCIPNPCTAPHRGVCSDGGGTAICSCDPGWRDDGQGHCVPATPCDPNPCTDLHRTQCSVSGTTAICSCDPGWHEERGGVCVEDDPCQPNPCTAAHQTQCTASGGSAACGCDPGWHEDAGGACVQDDPCVPNPCVDAHRGVCTASGPTAHACECDPGYVLGASGDCEAEPQPVCQGQHSAGDAFEPDECPALAGSASLPISRAQTLSPAGDVDWVRFEVAVAQRYVFTVTATGFTPALMVYSEDGTDALGTAAPTSGATAAVTLRLAPGRYLTKVRGRLTTDAGSYTLESAEAGPDDHGDTMPAATTIQAGDTGGKLEYSGDVDFFAFTAVAGHVYRVAVTSASYLNTAFYFGASDTSPRQHNGTYNASFTYELTAAGPYYLRVAAYGGGPVSSYAVSVTDLGLDDFADTIVTASPLAAGSTTGKLEYEGDYDVFSFQAVPGHVYRFTVTSGSYLDTAFYDGENDTSPATERGTYAASFTYELTAAGPYYLWVAAYGGGVVSSYTVTITDLGLDDFADTIATASPLSAGSTQGRLEYEGDYDMFSFQAVPGHVYRFAVTSGSYLNTAFYDGATDTSPATHSGTYNASFTYELTTAGPYYLWVAAYGGGVVSSYTVSVTDLGLDDFADTIATASPLAAGSTPGKLEYEGDYDAFAFQAVPGHVYRFAVTSGSYLNTAFYSGADDTTPDTSTGTYNSSYTYELTTVGPYYLWVAAYGGGVVSSYTITVTDLGVDDYGDSFATASPLPVGTTTGKIESEGDYDYFAFQATAGHVYRFAVTSGSYLNTAFYEGAGDTSPDSSTGTYNASYTYELNTAGPYYLRVAAYGGGVVSSYTVTVTDLGPDDHGDGGTASTALMVGEAATAGGFEWSGDEDWFRFDTDGQLSYQLVATGTSSRLEVRSAAGAVVTTLSGPGSATFSVPAAGTYHVRVRPSASGTLGQYTVQVTR